MNHTIKNIIRCVALFLITQAVLLAHQDTRIKLEGDKLIGLPEAYQPSTFNLEEKKLRLNDRELLLPEFIRDLFPNPKEGKLEIVASWYHNMDLPDHLPPYISFSLIPKGKDFSYHVLINMDTLAIVEVTVRLNALRGVVRHLPLDPELWKEDMEKAIRKLPNK